MILKLFFNESFEILIKGKGGHAALPHMSRDTITIGSQIILALQTIVSRKLDPVAAGVVSVTEFITDGKKNRGGYKKWYGYFS